LQPIKFGVGELENKELFHHTKHTLKMVYQKIKRKKMIVKKKLNEKGDKTLKIRMS